MFRNKKNKKSFKLNINKEQAEKEYREYLNQSPEVLENLRICKIFMAVFIPIGIVLTSAIGFIFEFKGFLGAVIAFAVCLLLGMVIFLIKKSLKNIKLRFVPLICLFFGWLAGILCIQKIILIFLNFAE